MEALDKIKRLYQGQIEMNSQIVLCLGINDGKELDRSIWDLSRFFPYMKSLSIVPVGLTKYRKGLTKLKKFEKEDARNVLKQIENWQEKFLKELGTRFVHASDEWFLIAQVPIPTKEYYEGYGQIENGVGMIRSFEDEVDMALKKYKELGYLPKEKKSLISLATGVLAAPILEKQMKKIARYIHGLSFHVYMIENEFFGKDITVAGLLTGQTLLLPDVLLRSGEQVLLDDLTIQDLEKALQIPIRIVQSDGESLLKQVINA